MVETSLLIGAMLLVTALYCLVVSSVLYVNRITDANFTPTPGEIVEPDVSSLSLNSVAGIDVESAVEGDSLIYRSSSEGFRNFTVVEPDPSTTLAVGDFVLLNPNVSIDAGSASKFGDLVTVSMEITSAMPSFGELVRMPVGWEPARLMVTMGSVSFGGNAKIVMSREGTITVGTTPLGLGVGETINFSFTYSVAPSTIL